MVSQDAFRWVGHESHGLGRNRSNVGNFGKHSATVVLDANGDRNRPTVETKDRRSDTAISGGLGSGGPEKAAFLAYIGRSVYVGADLEFVCWFLCVLRL